MPSPAEDGWLSFALNLRGHGGSVERECISQTRFADYASDVAHSVAYVETETGETPILLGHSLGSLLARVYAAHHAVPGIALLSLGGIKLGMKGVVDWIMKRYPLQGMIGMTTGGASAMFAKFGPQYDVTAGDQDPIASGKSFPALAKSLGTEAIILPGQAHDGLACADWKIGVEHLKDWFGAQFCSIKRRYFTSLAWNLVRLKTIHLRKCSE